MQAFTANKGKEKHTMRSFHDQTHTWATVKWGEMHLVCSKLQTNGLFHQWSVAEPQLFYFSLDVNSRGRSNNTFLCSEMQYGPYDAYMEVPYKNVDKDTKLAVQLQQLEKKR